MLTQHIDEARRQLELPITSITLRNVSEVAMVVPKRIIKRAGFSNPDVGERCFWESNE